MLTHYTRTVGAVANILTHGFAWFPNRRRLADLLIPAHDFSTREPQQFGMISFTEIEPKDADAHAKQFGPFGIVVSEQWAREKNAQRVIYVEESGAATEAWRNLFSIGYHDVQSRIRYPDDGGWLMAYESKSVARAIAESAIWANLLQIWEYMEPADVSHEREWRIVNSAPFYSLSDNKTEAIARVSPPQNWGKFTNVVPIACNEVRAFVSLPEHIDELIAVLPAEYKDIIVLKTGGAFGDGLA